jgi:hypothetical protein
MWLRITIDTDMVIHEAVAVTDASPFLPCGDITPKFSALVGKKIGRGWTKELRSSIGGVNGCTHQWELLGRVATVAFQSVNRFRPRKPRKPGDIPFHFNTCHMYAPDSDETLRRWPDLYTGPKPKPAMVEQQG